VMEPQRGSQATLEDLLERVLDKGIVLKLDLIIGVAGIPLIGISLQAAIAAIETMLDYGMMEAWDADTRAHAAREERRREFGFQPGEHPVLDLYGSYHRRRGISLVWQPGRLILTDRRLLLVRSAPPEVLFETLVGAIVGIGRVVHENLGPGRREIVSLALADGTVAGLYAAEPDVLEAHLREGIQRLGQAVTEIPAAQLERLDPGAVAGGQLWYRWVPKRGPALWRSGWAVLTGTELTWRGDMPQGALLRVPLTEIWRITIERREFGTLGLRDVLVVTHEAGKDRAEALFAGEGIGAWSEAIRRAALAGDGDGDGDGDAGS
jgi:Gas vesicle protein